MAETSGATGSAGRRVALITGAARGMGRAQAVEFADAGYDVVALDYRPPSSVASGAYAPLSEDFAVLTQVVGKAGGRVRAVEADVRSQAAVDAAVAEGLQEFGRIDAVVATAGVGNPFKPSWELTEDEFRAPVEVNLLGAWHVAKATIPTLIAQGGGGSVTFVGSGASLKGLLNLAGYVASKHAQMGLMRSLAREAGPHGIRVNMVLPGNTNTELFMRGTTRYRLVPEKAEPTDEEFLARAASLSPMRIPYVEVEDVARATVWLASDAARFVTGAAIPVDGGTTIP
ncbi:SDR family oxidoreductase [Streptomyces sp. NPDC097610]|uniref:SDR family oxidoreductase n=1 Tax=Streptomyces sp. NPDC097610 TaxID=3157227 RepID=UPI00331E6B84